MSGPCERIMDVLCHSVRQCFMESVSPQVCSGVYVAPDFLVSNMFVFSYQVAEERIANMRTVRAFVQEEREQQVYNQQITNVLNLTYKEALARGVFWATVRHDVSVLHVFPGIQA